MRWYQYKTDRAEYVTVREDVAADDFKEAVKKPWLSDFVALEGFISMRKAWQVNAPAGEGLELSTYMKRFAARAGGVDVASRKLDVSEKVINDIISGKRLKVPSYVLRRMGLKATVIVMPADAPA